LRELQKVKRLYGKKFFSLSRIDNILEQLSDNNWFSTLEILRVVTGKLSFALEIKKRQISRSGMGFSNLS